MEIVKTSKRIILLLLALVSFITLIFLYMGHLQHILVLETIVENEKDIGGKVYTNTFKLVSEHYESVADSILLNDEIIDAFERGDRKKLLTLTEPIYKQLAAQNPYLKIMHFHTPKSVSFLRVHQPDKFGDDLSSFRYIVNNVNAQKKKQIGLEVGRYGINYRVVVPVFNRHGKHLGSFELGIDIDYIFNIFHQNHGLENILFVNKEVFTIIHENNQNIKYKCFSDKYYVLEPSDNSISNVITPSDLAKNYFFVNYKETENLVFAVTEMRSVTGDEIGKIVFVKNINTYDTQIAILRNISIALGAVLILLSFYLLRKIFHHYTHIVGTYQRQLEIKNRTLSKLSHIDHLTKAHNRRSIERALSSEMKRAGRYDKPLSIMILDLDNFKQINDKYGHNTGDKVLKHTAKLVLEMIRKTDYFGRWGGEEFLLIATETPLEKAVLLAEQIRKSIHGYDFSEPSNVTCSIGVAQLRNGETLVEFVANADHALYEAKKSGRNKVVVHREREG